MITDDNGCGDDGDDDADRENERRQDELMIADATRRAQVLPLSSTHSEQERTLCAHSGRDMHQIGALVLRICCVMRGTEMTYGATSSDSVWYCVTCGTKIACHVRY
eukprot:237753-Rhodomonas_salina.1